MKDRNDYRLITPGMTYTNNNGEVFTSGGDFVISKLEHETLRKKQPKRSGMSPKEFKRRLKRYNKKGR